MAKSVLRTLDFLNSTKIINLPAGVNAGDAVNVSQLNAASEGLASKDNVRVATQANINLASPGATVDGITMASGDRVLVKAQTAQAENGVYIWNGAAVAMTRSLDTSTFDELESAIVPVDEGTSAGTTWRQTAVNGVLGTNNIIFIPFGTGAAAATEASAGIAEIATQAETDTGTDDVRFVTPVKLATSSYASKKFNADFGDGSATSYTLTHNLGTRNVKVVVYRNSGTFDEVDLEVQHTTTNSITLLVDTAPAANAFHAFVST
jgi:hypothetical protein